MTFAIISDQRIARLNTDFGLKLAEKWFPNMVEMLPRYKRGKNKGQLKAVLHGARSKRAVGTVALLRLEPVLTGSCTEKAQLTPVAIPHPWQFTRCRMDHDSPYQLGRIFTLTGFMTTSN